MDEHVESRFPVWEAGGLALLNTTFGRALVMISVQISPLQVAFTVELAAELQEM